MPGCFHWPGVHEGTWFGADFSLTYPRSFVLLFILLTASQRSADACALMELYTNNENTL